MKKVMIGMLAALVTAQAARAGGSSNATVTDFLTMKGGQVLFSVSGNRISPPGCATIPTRWAIDGSTPAGQTIVSNVLTAFSLKKSIYISGTGTCSVWGDTETVEYVVMYQ